MEETEVKKQTATLKDWHINSQFGVPVMYGTVFGHPKLRDGSAVRTSIVLKADFKKNTAETLNTIYKLED